MRILRNKQSNDILILVPKPKPGETLDLDDFEEFVKPFLKDMCNPDPNANESGLKNRPAGEQWGQWSGDLPLE